MTGQDYYTILGITPDASSEEIKKAYKALAFKYHPDRNLENREVAEEKFKELTEAYGVLIDSQKRRQYDHLRFSQNTQQQFASRYASSEVHFENLFKDMFSNPNASKVFHDLEQEGMGSDLINHSLKTCFLGGKEFSLEVFSFLDPRVFREHFIKRQTERKKALLKKSILENFSNQTVQRKRDNL
jgi:DnaJ-class molecular chaperone